MHARHVLLLIAFLIPEASAADEVEDAGDVLRILIPAAGLGASLYVEDDRKGTLQLLETLAVTVGVTEALKAITDKRRPNGECCQSFPSGHASMAFAGAGFIHRRYGFKYAILAYVGAGFTAVSRVHADKHFVEDVVAGAAVGLASSYLFTSRYEGVMVSPLADSESVGVTITRSW